jgi:hypothetical protein
MWACWVMVGLPKPYEQVTELEYQNSSGLSQSRSPVIASGLCEAISEWLGDCFLRSAQDRKKRSSQ